MKVETSFRALVPSRYPSRSRLHRTQAYASPLLAHSPGERLMAVYITRIHITTN